MNRDRYFYGIDFKELTFQKNFLKNLYVNKNMYYICE